MRILDAIETAPSEHAVFFLVTAYLESLHHFQRGLGMPEDVFRLPVTGVMDLEERLASLHHITDAPLDNAVAASEVSAVLLSAVQRLAADSAQVREKR
jgi:hypothetical protein